MKDLGQQLVCVKVCVCAPEGASVTSSSLQPYGLYHLSMGFSRQEYWSGLPYPPSGGLPNPGIKPASCAAPALQADSLPLSHLGIP